MISFSQLYSCTVQYHYRGSSVINLLKYSKTTKTNIISIYVYFSDRSYVRFYKPQYLILHHGTFNSLQFVVPVENQHGGYATCFEFLCHGWILVGINLADSDFISQFCGGGFQVWGHHLTRAWMCYEKKTEWCEFLHKGHVHHCKQGSWPSLHKTAIVPRRRTTPGGKYIQQKRCFGGLR